MAGTDILVKVGADISDFSRNISKATQDMSSMGKASNGLTFGKLLGAVGITAAAAKGFNMVKESVGRAFSRIDTMEQFERVMTTMTGSSKKAQSVLDDVNETVKGTAYGLDVGAKAVQSFVTSNMDVDKATMTFAAWGDAVAFYGDGTNETLGSVTDALAKATAKGKIQMDTMNRLTEAGIPAMEIYADATGQSVEDVANQMQKGQLKADEFINVMNDAMMNGTKSFESIKGAAKEAGASWSGSFDNMHAAVARGVNAIIKNIDDMLKSNGLPDMREMIVMFGAKFEEVLKKAADAIPKVVDKLKEVYNTLEPWLPLLGSLAAAFGTVFTAVATYNTIKGIIDAVKASQVALNIAAMMNPWGLVAMAVIAAVALIYKYWDEIKAFTIEAWGAIRDFFSELWTSIKETAIAAWEGIKTFFSELWTSIVEIASTAWNSFVEVIMAIVQPFIDGITNIFNGMKDGLQTIWDGLKQYFSGVWELIKNIFLGAVLLIFNLVTGNFKELRSNTVQIFGNIREALRNIWQGIRQVFSGALSAIWGGVRSAWSNIRSNTSAVFSAVRSIIQTVWGAIRKFFTETLRNMWNDLRQRFADMRDAARDRMNEARQNIVDAWNRAVEFLRSIDLAQIGRDVINGFIRGIRSRIGAVANAARDAADAVTGKIKSILGIASPSRVLAQIGRWTGEGLALGIEKTTGLVERASEALADAATPDMPELSMSYATPAGVRASLSSAVRGTVDVNARDDMIAAAIDNLSRKLENMRIEMDRREMGRFVSDITTEDRNSAVRGRGHRRING